MKRRDDADPKAAHAELVGRRFVAEEVVPRAAGIDRENAFPGDVYRRMGEVGLLGLQESLDHLRAGCRLGDRAGEDGPGSRRERLQQDLPLERYVRDAKLTQIYEGTNQIQREVLARQLLG